MDGSAPTTSAIGRSHGNQRAFRIRKATPVDAEGVVRIWRIVAAERVHSAVDQPWSVEQEREFIAHLSDREAIHVAESPDGLIVGFQSIDLWSAFLNTMSHVGQLGTFIDPAWRRRGVGAALFTVTRKFAISAGYRKLAIQVRASNSDAQSYYKSNGFAPCGRLTKQVIIDGVEDDEILMEVFL